MTSSNPHNTDNPELSAVLQTLSAFSTPAHPQPHPPQNPHHQHQPQPLKHVTRLVSYHDNVSLQIRHLIKSQHSHEKQWWAGREALVAKQQGRGEKQRQLEEVLKSVGAVGTSGGRTGDKISTDEENAIELRYYDAKVHRACVDMARSMESELRRLGVPFFSIKESLVLTTTGSATTSKESDGRKDGSPVSRDELAVMKKRMVEFLQDLCRD
ncbi:hypothetical protein BGW36DRAFT_426028 [Talaromyces proteolyticus]|uniref:Uncharacterized protein n=1 Tax=Talaromyces proteolyticus TaxID=1131652 RepID=A0AAD4KQL8_9EURO|nr:uncharacterized protein BGW36DRAFT_426028 [Talaromyces proteolyticus]KAH8698315.1 hypothetical protein BGW36DRAFT_426028 [Talaromyces proteolyticus]